MGGFLLIADQTMAPDLPNLVLVEGGPRAIKRFKRLMLRRIDWNSKTKHKIPAAENSEDHPMNSTEDQQETIKEEDDEDDKIKSSKDRKCHLIWEGVHKKKSFEKWRIVEIRSENEARRLLGEKNCDQFWNMALTFQPERAEGEEPEDVAKLLA
jgi:U4/U6 small nuclear ribonucleoprotein PRP3